MSVYNENRDKNQGIWDEIREQNAKLKGAPLKEKLSYFKDYYLRTSIVILIVLVLAGSLLHTIITSPRGNALGAVFLNSTNKYTDSDLAASFAEKMQIDTTKENIYIDTSLSYYYDDETETSQTSETEAVTPQASGAYNSYMDVQKLMALIAAKELDIIVAPETAFNYCRQGDAMFDLREILDQDKLDQYKDKIYYAKNYETGEMTPYGIYVTDAPKLIENSYYVNEEPILGFVSNAQNIETAIAFLDYIYE